MSNQAIEQRVYALEAAFEEVRRLKGVPGPRGPAGPIDAAVANANRAVADAEARVQAKANATYAKFAAEVKALREEFKLLREQLAQNIQTEVENRVVQVLRDYHLLDENHAPTDSANVTHPNNVK
jgi:hypothetical protein